MRISASGHSPDAHGVTPLLVPLRKEGTMPHARRLRLLPLLFILPLVAVPAMAGDDHHDGRHLRAKLIGFQEVPAVSTVARGDFKATIAEDEQSIEYELTYSGLQGTVLQAHIHVAQRDVNGSIVIWLCGTAALPGPGGGQRRNFRINCSARWILERVPRACDLRPGRPAPDCGAVYDPARDRPVAATQGGRAPHHRAWAFHRRRRPPRPAPPGTGALDPREGTDRRDRHGRGAGAPGRERFRRRRLARAGRTATSGARRPDEPLRVAGHAP